MNPHILPLFIIALVLARSARADASSSSFSPSSKTLSGSGFFTPESACPFAQMGTPSAHILGALHDENNNPMREVRGGGIVSTKWSDFSQARGRCEVVCEVVKRGE